MTNTCNRIVPSPVVALGQPSTATLYYRVKYSSSWSWNVDGVRAHVQVCGCSEFCHLRTRSCWREFRRARVDDLKALFPVMAVDWWVTLRPRLVPGTGASLFEKRCEQVLCMTSPVFVASCMTILFVCTMNMKPEGSEPFIGLMPYVQPQGETLWQNVLLGAVLNGAYIMAYVIVLTFLFLFLYAKLYARVLYTLLVGAFIVAVASFSGYWLISVCALYKIPLDQVTIAFLIFNVVVGGVVCVYYAPLHHVLFPQFADGGNAYFSRPMNFYLLLHAVALAWPFACFSEWTVFFTLCFLIVWDLLAVLTPCGPLALIMKINRRRVFLGEETFELPPGLVYHHRLFNLGTGDITFYAVLVARAALIGYLNALSCVVALTFGIYLTVLCTIHSTREALPALPIALGLGICSFFLVRFLLVPFLQMLLGVSGGFEGPHNYGNTSRMSINGHSKFGTLFI